MARSPAERERRIAVCVDDAGLHPGVTAAVMALAGQARVSAVSCMVGAPDWPRAARELRLLDPARVDVGLHLDLTEHPLDARLRRPVSQWLLRSHLGLVDGALLRREFDGQLAAFEHAMGRPPAYIDGHQHVHQLPGVRAALLAALQARNDRPRPWLRSTRRPAAGATRKAWVIEASGEHALRRQAGERGFRQNGHLLGVYDFAGDADRYLALLAGWASVAQDADLLMAHPATDAPAEDVIGPARRWEYAVLAGDAFGELLARERLRVEAMSRILAAAS